MLMTKVCECMGCKNPAKIKETYKVLDDKFNLYSFKVNLCHLCFERIHEIKEKVVGDFSIFFSEPIKKRYH